MISGAPASSSSAGGFGATVMNPANQQAADQSLQQLILPLIGLSANAGAGTPAGVNYPIAQQQVYGDLLNPDFQNQAIAAAQNAADSAAGITSPFAFGGANQLYNQATSGLPFANQALAQGFDPRYSKAISDIENNPYYSQALSGALQAAAMGSRGAQAMEGMAGQVGGTVKPILEAGFDPQAALFNRTQGRLMDQTNAINAMAGLGGTPYGASVGANAMGNFDIDWQNQQLGRETQAAGAAGQAANTAGGLYTAAPGLMSTTSGLPSNVYTGHIGQILQALGQRNQAANQGIAGYGSLLGGAGQAFGQANQGNLLGTQALQQYGAAPYNTAAGIANNSLTGLSNLTNLGNNQFQLPQQEIANLMQYMGLGQQASGLSGQLGNLGFQQTAQGIGGLLSGGNALFGGNGLLGSNGAFGSNGLFGGAGGLFGSAAPALNFGGGGTEAFVSGLAGVPDVAAAAPLALSA